MKSTQDYFDPGTRITPREWIPQRHHGAMQRSRQHAGQRWMSSVHVPLSDVRACTMEALTEVGAEVAYLYESDDKVVLRCTLPQRQVRAELTRLPDGSDDTRIIVVAMRGTELDRHTSSVILEAIERRLEPRSLHGPRSHAA